MEKSLVTLAELQQRFGSRHRWLALTAVLIGTIAAVMSSTVVSVALPALGNTFGLGQSDLQWVNTVFMLAMTISMLITPWMLRCFGYRQTYIGMMCLLGGGALIGATAINFTSILVARLMEGIAAGVVQPIPAIIVLRAFRPEEQGRASGLFGMAVVLAPALAPGVGGLLMEWSDWRAIFWMVVPFCVVSIGAAVYLIPETGPGGVIPGFENYQLDWLSISLLSLGSSGLLIGISVVSHGQSVVGWLLGVLSLLGLVFFLMRQVKLNGSNRSPLINTLLFDSHAFIWGSCVAFVYGFTLFGSTYLLAVYMQTGLGLASSKVGVIFLPAGLMLALTIGIGGFLIGRIKSDRMIWAGMWVLAISFACMLFVKLNDPLSALLATTVLGRFGMGLVAPALNLSSTQSIPKELTPEAASTLNFIRLFGGAIGMFLVGFVLDNSSKNHEGMFGAFDEYDISFLMLSIVGFIGAFASSRISRNIVFPSGSH